LCVFAGKQLDDENDDEVKERKVFDLAKKTCVETLTDKLLAIKQEIEATQNNKDKDSNSSSNNNETSRENMWKLFTTTHTELKQWLDPKAKLNAKLQKIRLFKLKEEGMLGAALKMVRLSVCVSLCVVRIFVWLVVLPFDCFSFEYLLFIFLLCYVLTFFIFFFSLFFFPFFFLFCSSL
jgi:hypothetical protein